MADEQTKNETPTQEEKASVKAELEAEAERNDKLVETATQPLRQQISQLEQELAAKTADIEALKADLAGATAAYAYAVDDYKKLVLQANPFITPELVAGDTVEAVKVNVDRANALVAKVKASLEAQAATLTHLANVPAGAPPRSEPDISALSPAEKIAYGLEQAKKKK